MSTSPTTSLVPVNITLINRAIPLIRARAEQVRLKGREQAIASVLTQSAAHYGYAKWYNRRKLTDTEARRLVDTLPADVDYGTDHWKLINWRYDGYSINGFAKCLEAASKLLGGVQGTNLDNAVIYLNLDDAQAVQSYL